MSPPVVGTQAQVVGRHVPARRADAERNRERIVVAARRLFAREGLGVSMSGVAREAGVGKATVSRHFATTQHLVDAVFADRMDDYARVAAEAMNAEPWTGFAFFVSRVCEMQALDRGFADVLTLSFPAAPALEGARARAYQGFLTIIERAKSTGHLQSDFASEDLILLLMANAGVLAGTAVDAPDSWRRLVGQMLRAYATPGVPILPLPAAPASVDLYRAMTRTADRP